MMVLFFFFKQRTAYEVRISDWSSDVCSSDLRTWRPASPYGGGASRRPRRAAHQQTALGPRFRQPRRARLRSSPAASPQHGRSEEHTSELQSLMRISYAVFCLKKKTEKIKNRP